MSGPGATGGIPASLEGALESLALALGDDYREVLELRILAALAVAYDEGYLLANGNEVRPSANPYGST